MAISFPEPRIALVSRDHASGSLAQTKRIADSGNEIDAMAEHVHTCAHDRCHVSVFKKFRFRPSTLMRFHIYPLWRAFSKRSFLGVRKHRFSMPGRSNWTKKKEFKFIRISMDGKGILEKKMIKRKKE